MLYLSQDISRAIPDNHLLLAIDPASFIYKGLYNLLLYIYFKKKDSCGPLKQFIIVYAFVPENSLLFFLLLKTNSVIFLETVSLYLL